MLYRNGRARCGWKIFQVLGPILPRVYLLELSPNASQPGGDLQGPPGSIPAGMRCGCWVLLFLWEANFSFSGEFSVWVFFFFRNSKSCWILLANLLQVLFSMCSKVVGLTFGQHRCPGWWGKTQELIVNPKKLCKIPAGGGVGWDHC